MYLQAMIIAMVVYAVLFIPYVSLWIAVESSDASRAVSLKNGCIVSSSKSFRTTFAYTLCTGRTRVAVLQADATQVEVLRIVQKKCPGPRPSLYLVRTCMIKG